MYCQVVRTHGTVVATHRMGQPSLPAVLLSCGAVPRWQDFVQVLSMFAGLGFRWPPAIKGIFNAFSLVNFNFELLAPECSISLNFERKWCVTQVTQQRDFHICCAWVLGLWSQAGSCFLSGSSPIIHKATLIQQKWESLWDSDCG
jgi:hypothetical protein